MLGSKKIMCMSVDDEHTAAVPALSLDGTCNNSIEALSMLLEKHIDLIFLDINMPQLSGTDLVRTIKNPPKIIFTTAYRKYAVEGFELDFRADRKII
jgi:two-component SAPR family response regulator